MLTSTDVNCRLKIRWNDNQEDFSDTLDNLRDLGFFIYQLDFGIILELLLVKFVFS